MEEQMEMETVDYSDKDDLIKIVAFDKRRHDVLIGYRQNNRVVYASVSTNLDDATAKQRGYEQVYRALQYEQTLDAPSIDGSDMEPIEVFTPAERITTTVKINGPTTVSFDDDVADKTVPYIVVAYDQYDDVVTSQTIERTFNNTDGYEVVSATIDEITATLNVAVRAYKESEIDTLKKENNLLNLKVDALTSHNELIEGALVELTSLILE